MMTAIKCCLCASVLLCTIIGCRKSGSAPNATTVSPATQSQEIRVLALARDHLDKKVLGTPGGSAKWGLKAHRIADVWIVPIPDDIQKGMPGGFPHKVIVDLEKNSATAIGFE